VPDRRYRTDDREFDRRYQQLLDHAEQARGTAGFAKANLKRALTSKRTPDISFQTTCHIRN